MLKPIGKPFFQRGGYQSGYIGRRGGFGYRGRGRGFGGSRRVIGELSAQPNQTLKSQLEEAFDFDEANRKFGKTQKEGGDGSLATEGKENEKALPQITAVYDKKQSFFDRISCETLDRQAGHDTRVDRTKQRKLDVETFGQAAAVPIRRGGRGFRRGGGLGVMNMMNGGYHTGYPYGGGRF